MLQAPQALSELRLVQLSDLTKREVIIGRLPLEVQAEVKESVQPLQAAAKNPTLWLRQPFVIIAVVRLCKPSVHVPGCHEHATAAFLYAAQHHRHF